MDSHSPYRPPKAEEPRPRPAYPLSIPPKSVIVFSGLHFFFGTFWIFGLSLATTAIIHDGSGTLRDAVRLMVDGPIAFIMAYAGFRLSQKRRSGITWSHAYAAVSITVTLLKIAGSVRHPELFALSPERPHLAFLGWMVHGLSLAYPVLAIVCLSLPRIRTWAATLPR